MLIKNLNTEEFANKIRKHTLTMTSLGKSSHIGSILSIADLVAVLFSNMSLFSENPKDDRRDRFILSKGHAGAAIYAALAELNFFSKDILRTHYQDGSILSGHISHKGIPGIELSTGSLGHGLSVACGMALSAKLKEKKHNVFAILSDGELDEGSNWEAIMFAAHNKLNNLTVLLDYNKLQSLKSTEETMALEPLADKIKAFNWEKIEVDGHDHEQIFKALEIESERPKFIIAHTVKGKGVDFMENKVLWHYRSPDEKDLENALNQLGD